MNACKGRQMECVRRGSWRVLDRDEFLNITIEISYELQVFLFELKQVRQSPRVRVLQDPDTWGTTGASLRPFTQRLGCYVKP